MLDKSIRKYVEREENEKKRQAVRIKKVIWKLLLTEDI